MSNPFRYFNSSPEVIRLVVMMYVRYPLSLRNVEDLLAERGIDISHETVRFWWNRFGPMFAAEIRKKRVAHMRAYPQWRWHLDEAFVKVNGKLCYLWRAVDHEGEVLETVVTAKRDKAAALKFLKRIMKKYGRPRTIVTDGLCSYPAAMKEVGIADLQEVGRRLNNRAENSHQPFRRRERTMQRFRSMKTLQKFSSVHAEVHNHFNQERHLVTRRAYKQGRAGAHVAMVTPLRDGMNLVAKEYLAAQDPEDPGVLLLSQFAGAAKELGRALIINPHETDAVAAALKRALELPLDERRERHTPMLAHLLKHDIKRWASSYTSTLVDGGTRRGLLEGIRSRFKPSTAQTPHAALRGIEAR